VGTVPAVTFRRAALSAVLSCVLFAAACGSGDSDEDNAASAVRSYFAALADGDGGKACGHLTGNGQRLLLELVFADLPVQAQDTCAENVEAMADSFGHEEKDALRDAKVTAMLSDRDTATATIEGSAASPTVQKGRDGTWRIEDGLFD
jgi:hypothetical protein